MVLFFWICGYAWKREGWLRTRDINVDVGRRELDWDEINAYKAQVAAMPAWRRAFQTVFV